MVEKERFDAVLSALLKAAPTPFESFKPKRSKKAQTDQRKAPKK
jgi:hypothetical protein